MMTPDRWSCRESPSGAIPEFIFQEHESMANAWVLSALWVGLFGLNHQMITQAQYSFLVSAVIASAVLPTLVANTFFLPRHLLPRKTHGGDQRLPVKPPVPTGEEA
jgi:hypothetical protein